MLSVFEDHVRLVTRTTLLEIVVRLAVLGEVTVAPEIVNPEGNVISATPAVRALSALNCKVTETPLLLRLLTLSSIALLTQLVAGCVIRPGCSVYESAVPSNSSRQARPKRPAILMYLNSTPTQKDIMKPILHLS